jgi:hypothetical protein
MPIIWIGFSTETSPAVAKWKDDPPRLKEYVAGVADEAGAKLLDLYFEVGQDRACALIFDLDNFIDIKSVTRILGADEATKLVDSDQAKHAREQEQRLSDAGDRRAGGDTAA